MSQLHLFDPPARSLVYDGTPPSRPVDTSIAAAQRQRNRAPTIREIILQHVRDQGDLGVTAEEAGAFLAMTRGLPPETPACRLTAAARLTELKLGGFVRDSGRRRETSGHCKAIVWTATDKAGDGRICERD